MKKSYLIFAVALLAAIVSVSAVFADGEKTLVVGFDQNFPPYGYVGEDGEFTGYDLDLAAEVAKRLDLEIVYQNGSDRKSVV